MMTLLNSLPQADALKLAGMMNARYTVSPRELSLPVAYRNAVVTIYRNDAALGRAWIVPQARIVSDTLAALADPTFDPRQVVLIEPADALALPAGEFAAGQWSAALRDSPNAVTIRAASDFGGFLVLADTFYPGWQATLDGKPAKILCADHALRAVVLPPGEHTVVFHYTPLSFRVGALVSCLTLVAVIGVLIVASRRQRQAGSQSLT